MPISQFFKTTKPPFILQEARLGDMADCAALHGMSFAAAWDEDDLTKMLCTSGTVVLVARVRRKSHHPIGAFLIYRIAGKEAEILSIATDPSVRKKRAASLLVEEMIRRCQSDRLEEIFLEVDETNANALKLYRRNGFVKVGSRTAYYTQSKGNTEQATDAWIMRRDLNKVD